MITEKSAVNTDIERVKKCYNKPKVEIIDNIKDLTKGTNDANSADGNNFYFGNPISQN